MPLTRYQHSCVSCVGMCNRPQRPARRTGHHSSNAVIEPFAPPSTLCPHHHFGNNLLLTGLARAPILPTVCGISSLSFSANIRLHTEAFCTTTRSIPKRHREHFRSSKSGNIDNRASFPDDTTPEDRVRAQVGTPLTSVYTEHY